MRRPWHPVRRARQATGARLSAIGQPCPDIPAALVQLQSIRPRDARSGPEPCSERDDKSIAGHMRRHCWCQKARASVHDGVHRTKQRHGCPRECRMVDSGADHSPPAAVSSTCAASGNRCKIMRYTCATTPGAAPMTVEAASTGATRLAGRGGRYWSPSRHSQMSRSVTACSEEAAHNRCRDDRAVAAEHRECQSREYRHRLHHRVQQGWRRRQSLRPWIP